MASGEAGRASTTSCRRRARSRTSTSGSSRCLPRSGRLAPKGWASRRPSPGPPPSPTRSPALRACACATSRSIARFWRGFEATDGSLRGYVARTLPGRSTILVSNRAPHDPREDGSFPRGAGGVVTCLLTLAEATGADWVACARTDAERRLAERAGTGLKVRLNSETGRLHYATPTREQYDMYYGVIANPVLWFIQHYLWDLGHEPVIDDRG